MAALSQPLFYAPTIAQMELVSIMLGALAQPAIDVISFTDQASGDQDGADQDRQLALPYLPGMDAVVIDDASLRFVVADAQLETTAYSVSPGPSGQGIVLKLPAPARLLKVDLSYSFTAPPGQTARLIVRPVTDGGFGPPILAAPDFGPPGPTYGRMLTGMTVTSASNGRVVATLPKPLGSSWLLQVATGDDPASLAPQSVAPTVSRVVLAAAPRNLSVVLKGPPDTPLWGNPNLLLPDAGEQTVRFVPMAQRALQAALQAASPSAVTLPLTLRFHSDTGATLNVTQRALSGHYTVAPLATPSVTLRLGGRPAPLELAAPSGLRPSGGSAVVVARPLGRALNGGSPAAPPILPGRGLRITTDKLAAAPVTVAPRGDATAPVPLAAVGLRLAAPEATELSVELRADAAGRPGAVLAAPMVRQVDAGYDDWLDLVLPAPASVAVHGTVWVSLRLTKGTLLWHAGSAAGGGALVSIDKGASWGDAGADLQPAAPPLVQAFHVVDPPYPVPVIALHDGTSVLLANWFTGGAATGPKEFRLGAAALPEAALRILAAGTPSEARARTTLYLDGDQVMDLVLSDMTLSYDPTGARPA